MSRTVTGELNITDVPVVTGDESYQIRLEKKNVVDTSASRIDALTKPAPRNLIIIQEEIIKRIGRNFEPVLATMTSDSKLVKKQVAAIERLRGTVNNEVFRFNAELLDN
jgi:hypothetical protein